MRRRQRNVAEVGLGVVVWRGRRYNEEEIKGKKNQFEEQNYKIMKTGEERLNKLCDVYLKNW